MPFSFHCAVYAQRRPASLAADLTDTRWKTFTHEQRAVFFRHLGELANAHGLVWGGDWKRTNAVYAAPPYEMCWDPVHVQLLPNSSLDSVRDRTLAVLREAAPAATGGAAVILGLLGLGGLFVAMRR